MSMCGYMHMYSRFVFIVAYQYVVYKKKASKLCRWSCLMPTTLFHLSDIFLLSHISLSPDNLEKQCVVSPILHADNEMQGAGH